MLRRADLKLFFFHITCSVENHTASAQNCETFQWKYGSRWPNIEQHTHTHTHSITPTISKCINRILYKHDYADETSDYIWTDRIQTYTKACWFARNPPNSLLVEHIYAIYHHLVCLCVLPFLFKLHAQFTQRAHTLYVARQFMFHVKRTWINPSNRLPIKKKRTYTCDVRAVHRKNSNANPICSMSTTRRVFSTIFGIHLRRNNLA